jgi:membrane fusion protein (multidrug efflux system)
MSDRPRVLVADSDSHVAQSFADCLGHGFDSYAVESGADALAALDGEGMDAVVVGRALADMTGGELLASLRARGAEGPPVLTTDAALVEEPPVWFFVSRRMAPDDVQTVVGAALGRRPEAPAAAAGISSRSEAAGLQQVLELSRKFALQKDLPGARAVAVGAIAELIDADRAQCLFYDAGSGSVWTEGASDDVDTVATRGLVGFSARTGVPVMTSSAREDGRYDRKLDDPRGDGDERILVQPVSGPDGQVHALFVAVREGRRPAFTDNERARIQMLAGQSGPLLSQLALQLEATELLQEDVTEQALFRREAVEAMASAGKQGDVIRVSPAWVTWSYWLLVALVVAAGVYMVVGRINQYSAGPAVVRVSGRTELAAKQPGTLVDVYVSPGQSVAADELLARFDDTEQRAAFERAQRELEAQLRNRMLDPGDAATAQAVQTLRERADAAETQLRELQVRAPRAGTIGDVRVREGQHVIAGDPLLSMVSGGAELSVIAFLPGGDRPRLSTGMTLRLELRNYRYAYQTLTVDSVDAEVIGPYEAKRFLGPQLADAVPINGPVVLVRARLPKPTFEADGVEYRYFDGMQAIAEVKVDSKSVLATIVPGLERFVD